MTKHMTLEEKRMVIAEQLARTDLNAVQRDFWIRSAEAAGMPLYPWQEDEEIYELRQRAARSQKTLDLIIVILVVLALAFLMLGVFVW